MIKTTIQKILGANVLGVIDYYRFPDRRKSWGGPLNNQSGRQKMVSELLNQLNVGVVVETGTFQGTSTEYFADHCQGDIFTIEADERLYGFCRMRFMFRRNITLLHNDSRSAIRRLIPELRSQEKPILFYLDAHWGDDLPLAEELDLIFSHWSKALVLIDDFQVPDDQGYTYDDYGEGKALTLEYTKLLQEKYQLKTFFPNMHSSDESGSQRGCVLFVADADLITIVNGLASFRSY